MKFHSSLPSFKFSCFLEFLLFFFFWGKKKREWGFRATAERWLLISPLFSITIVTMMVSFCSGLYVMLMEGNLAFFEEKIHKESRVLPSESPCSSEAKIHKEMEGNLGYLLFISRSNSSNFSFSNNRILAYLVKWCTFKSQLKGSDPCW